MPEFFAILGIDIFLLLSLLSCLLDDRISTSIPYVYQIAALAGYGQILISKEFFVIFGEYMRFWYCFIYLIVALANIAAVNIYLVAVKKLWTIAKMWSGAVTFPTVLISVFFISQYVYINEATLPLLTLQIGLVVSAVVMGFSAFLLLSPGIRKSRKYSGRSIERLNE